MWRTETCSPRITRAEGQVAGDFFIMATRKEKIETLYHTYHATFNKAQNHLIGTYGIRIKHLQRAQAILERDLAKVNATKPGEC